MIEGDARRKRSGSGWSYSIGGETIQSVSRIIRDGVPSPNLIGWAARTVAGYAVDHWTELADLPPSKRIDELKGAPNAERDAAAGRGTTIHRFAEDLAAGVEVEIPDALIGHVDAYLSFVEAYGVEDVAIECGVIYRGGSIRTSYGGTFDLLARLDGKDDLWILDWKTGASGIWPETSLQLAAYAHAQTILADDGTESPMPEIAHGAAVWLRADGYDVIPVDIGDETFRTFQYAQQVAHFAGADRAQYVKDALPARHVGVAS